jgi:hypothetical protein
MGVEDRGRRARSEEGTNSFQMPVGVKRQGSERGAGGDIKSGVVCSAGRRVRVLESMMLRRRLQNGRLSSMSGTRHSGCPRVPLAHLSLPVRHPAPLTPTMKQQPSQLFNTRSTTQHSYHIVQGRRCIGTHCRSDIKHNSIF